MFAVTGAEAYVRFHGRNRENWYKRDGGAAERFKYLYAEAELAPWAERLKSLSDVRRASVIFNNCYSNFGVMNTRHDRRRCSGTDGRKGSGTNRPEEKDTSRTNQTGPTNPDK